jgi:hypothetical protein
MTVIESKEYYELIARDVVGGKAWSDLNETIEALREVARAKLSKAIEDWEGAARPSPGAAHDAVVSKVGTFREWLEVNEPALAALPDWLFED